MFSFDNAGVAAVKVGGACVQNDLSGPSIEDLCNNIVVKCIYLKHIFLIKSAAFLDVMKL